MKLTICAAIAALALVAPRADAAGQSRTMQGEQKTVTATIEAIDRATRTVTIKEQTGLYVDVVAPPEVRRFDTLKVGDKITARYYDNVVLRLKQPGEKTVDTDTVAATAGSGPKAGATLATQRVVTATIAAIDLNIPSVTFTGPNGWKYSSRVADLEALKKVKVGDKIEITWTNALLISAEAPAPQ